MRIFVANIAFTTTEEELERLRAQNLDELEGQLATHALEDRAGVVAQVAAGPAVERDGSHTADSVAEGSAGSPAASDLMKTHCR